jgi:hypothetical protein
MTNGFWFDGELLAVVQLDAEGDHYINYCKSTDLYLGAVKLFCQWQLDMYDEYGMKESEF